MLSENNLISYLFRKELGILKSGTNINEFKSSLAIIIEQRVFTHATKDEIQRDIAQMRSKLDSLNIEYSIYWHICGGSQKHREQYEEIANANNVTLFLGETDQIYSLRKYVLLNHIKEDLVLIIDDSLSFSSTPEELSRLTNYMLANDIDVLGGGIFNNISTKEKNNDFIVENSSFYISKVNEGEYVVLPTRYTNDGFSYFEDGICSQKVDGFDQNILLFNRSKILGYIKEDDVTSLPLDLLFYINFKSELNLHYAPLLNAKLNRNLIGGVTDNIDEGWFFSHNIKALTIVGKFSYQFNHSGIVKKSFYLSNDKGVLNFALQPKGFSDMVQTYNNSNKNNVTLNNNNVTLKKKLLEMDKLNKSLQIKLRKLNLILNHKYLGKIVRPVWKSLHKIKSVLNR